MKKILLISLISIHFCYSDLPGELKNKSQGNRVPFELLKKLLPENPIILEAGAHIGKDTKWMSETWPKGTLHAFEPFQQFYNQLIKVAETHSNIKCYPFALSLQEGSANFYVAGGASSLLKPTDAFNNAYFKADLKNPSTVTCIKLDNWANQYNITKIDFMWLDMEGNELNALKAGTETLKKTHLIYIEVNLQNFWHECVQYTEMKQWLENKGFKEIWKDIAPNWHGNILFLNQSKAFKGNSH